MKTVEFIQKAINGYAKDGAHCSSVLYRNGVVYSYGEHYPLLFRIGNKVFVNTSGYSNTTAKHIGWASRYANHNVELVRCNSKNHIPTLENVREALEDEYSEVSKAYLKGRLNSMASDRRMARMNEIKELLAVL